MKIAKKQSVRPIIISDMTIKPQKILRTNSIRPAKSLRKTRLQIQTPVQALFNRKYSNKETTEE